MLYDSTPAILERASEACKALASEDKTGRAHAALRLLENAVLRQCLTDGGRLLAGGQGEELIVMVRP
jgi:hypothetical protein